MSRNRVIQLLAVLLAVAGLIGSAVLIGPINSQRRELQLSYDVEVGDEVPPQVALLTTMAGSFRGILVDSLWYRAEMEKRAGKYYEANALANWITTLQPRFPQVWAFNAWNMAYNISVGTHTPAERWDWVSKGVKLLRDKGIPYNPDSVQLYRELAWIWFHKIGGRTDDMNVFYKVKVAERWQQLLGSQSEGAPAKQVLASFKPIRNAADRYFSSELGRPGHKVLAALDKLADASSRYADQVKTFKRMPVSRLDERLDELQRQARDKGRSQPVMQSLDHLAKLVSQTDARAKTDRLVRLYQNAPSTKPLVKRLRQLDYALDEPTLRRIGRIESAIKYGPVSRQNPKTMLQWASEALGPKDGRLLRVMVNQDYAKGWNALLPYLRAKILVQNYHMDPAEMYQLMQTFGPLDWRHPMSHGAYWAAMGIKKSGQVLDKTKIDILNTDRRVIQAMQSLMHTGRVNYNPFASTVQNAVSYQPDPRFIPAYDKAVDQAMARIKAAKGTDVDYAGGVPKSFQAGHENFLQTAVVFSYLYGNIDQARKYYRKVRNLYSDTKANQRSGRYNQPLEDFVMHMVLKKEGGRDFNRAFITSRIKAGLNQGLANNRQAVFARNLRLARQALKQYNKKRSTPNPTANAQRMAFQSFTKMLTDVYVDYMRNQRIPLYRRSRVYKATPIMELIKKAYPRFRDDVAAEIAKVNPNADPAFLFPPPPGAKNQPKGKAPKSFKGKSKPPVQQK